MQLVGFCVTLWSIKCNFVRMNVACRLHCVSVSTEVCLVPSVSTQSDGDRKKKPKGTLESKHGLPTKLATLKVFHLQTLHV